MATQSRTTVSRSTWALTAGKVGSEYDATAPQPQLLIWTRRQSADGDKRERLANAFRRAHAQLERKTLESLSPVFDSLTGKILDRFNQAGTVAVQVNELFHQAELAIPFNNAMRPCWMRAAETGIHFEADWVGAIKPKQSYVPVLMQFDGPPLPSIDVEMSAFLQKALKDWLKNRVDGVWSEVAKTIHTRLESTLKRGLRDGLTLKDMTAEIEGVVKGIKEYQAKRIARTETTGGMNFGGQCERTDLGIEHKEWVSTIDARTRGISRKSRYDHISSNGEIVLNKDPFIVSGQKLTYPADGSLGASAGNICNCRCCSVGAWPKTSLKPKLPEAPSEKPKDWIEPKYDKATLPTSPKPNRVLSKNATDDEVIQHNNLTRMDNEQRSQVTVDRINMVREKLTKANDSLEATRQKFISRKSHIGELESQIGDLQNQLNEAFKKKEDLSDLRKKQNSLLDDWHAAQKFAANNTLKDVNTGKTASFSATSDGQLTPAMESRAEDTARWLSQIVSEKHGKSLTLNFGTTPDQRAYYSNSKNKIFMGEDDRDSIYIHEASHFLEDCGNSQVHSLCKGFLYHRIGNEKAEWCGSGKQFEIGAKDDWEKTFGSDASYVGKYYSGATEIMAMGVQKLYEDPLDFATKDPEYFKFVIGVLRGDLL